MATANDRGVRRAGYNAPTLQESVELINRNGMISNVSLCRLLDITQEQLLGDTYRKVREILRKDSPYDHDTEDRKITWWELTPSKKTVDLMAEVMTEIKDACPEIQRVYSNNEQSWIADDGQIQPYLSLVHYNRLVQSITRGQMVAINSNEALRSRAGDAAFDIRPRVKKLSTRKDEPFQAAQKRKRFGIKPLRAAPLYLVKHDAMEQWWNVAKDSEGREAGLDDNVDSVKMWKVVPSEHRTLAPHEDYNRSQIRYDLVKAQCAAAWPCKEHRLSFQATRDGENLNINDQATLNSALSKMQELQEESDQDYVIFVKTMKPKLVDGSRVKIESA
ncbi:hypothetical protein AMS68_003004 [Peltaster fructicola]|uniref:Uncharacterized protein n=1 Tax=Peltaster fructicola TaxID=286661 RepID=A0A6H0XRV2_9PEZI|nr:hypothetical protein AMS68_003004 [Peltaster fructicola]